MANSLTSSSAGFGKLFSAAAIVAALFAPSAAQARLLDFENLTGSPVVFADDPVILGQTRLTGLGLPGLVGLIGGNEFCSGDIECPVNNNTNYYSALADGYFMFGNVDNSRFQLRSLDASFIGANNGPYSATPGVLYLAGFDATGTMVNETFLGLGGPVNGQFNFANYNLGSFGSSIFNNVLVAAFACNPTCNFDTNQASFAIDNLDINDVPEPGSFALIGLGLLGLGAFSRRRAV